MQTHEINKIDPVKKQPEKGLEGDGLSPMDPPEAYAPPATERVPLEQMHPFLRQFSQEHAQFMIELNSFEEAILAVRKTGYSKELDQKLRHFFHFFEGDFVPHSRREETSFFRLLNERLIADGEHSKGAEQTTPVGLMEDDHLKAVQLAAVILNFMGLALRLKDEPSRLMVLDSALEQGKDLVELLRLHIFREDNIIFSAAHRLISKGEFDRFEANVSNRISRVLACSSIAILI